jgi:hypothetical protein
MPSDLCFMLGYVFAVVVVVVEACDFQRGEIADCFAVEFWEVAAQQGIQSAKCFPEINPYLIALHQGFAVLLGLMGIGVGE